MRLLVLHGWGQNIEIWKPFCNRFNPNALSLDLPGFGSEPRPRDSWGVSEYAQWVEDHIKTLNEEVILLGHSFGGRVALELAGNNPSRLKGLILSGSPCIIRENTNSITKISEILKPLLPDWFRGQFRSQDYQEAIQNGLGDIFRNVVSYNQKSLTSRVTVPTLIIWGEKDTEVPLSVGKELHKSIAQSKLKILDNAGHNAFLDSPDLYYGYVESFFTHLQ